MNHIVLDFETTGVDVLYDLPIQAAVCVYDWIGKEKSHDSILINPGIEISPGAQKVHGIDSKLLEEKGKSLKWFTSYWKTLVWKNQPANLIGYNLINFDLIILQRILAFYGEGPFFYPPIEKVVDVMFLCCRFFQQKKWPRLIEAVNRLGIPHNQDDFHDALADVRYTWKVYDKIILERSMTKL